MLFLEGEIDAPESGIEIFDVECRGRCSGFCGGLVDEVVVVVVFVGGGIHWYRCVSHGGV